MSNEQVGVHHEPSLFHNQRDAIGEWSLVTVRWTRRCTVYDKFRGGEGEDQKAFIVVINIGTLLSDLCGRTRDILVSCRQRKSLQSHYIVITMDVEAVDFNAASNASAPTL